MTGNIAILLLLFITITNAVHAIRHPEKWLAQQKLGKGEKSLRNEESSEETIPLTVSPTFSSDYEAIPSDNETIPNDEVSSQETIPIPPLTLSPTFSPDYETIPSDNETIPNDNETLPNDDETNASKENADLDDIEDGFKTDDKERPIAAGDVFTPVELLPVAEKLIAKVERPGQGKGIVSSAQSPQMLADKLFQSFFLTQKRIVTLTDYDISGLDALQALSLSGEVANLRSHMSLFDSTVDQVTVINYNGQNIDLKTEPKKSKYLVLLKNEKSKVKKKIVLRSRYKARDLGKNNRQAKKYLKDLLKEIKILNKKRKRESNRGRNLKNKATRQPSNEKVVKGQNGKAKKKRLRLRDRGIEKKNTRTTLSGVAEEPKKPICTWKYVCTNPGDLDSCSLQTQCNSRFRKHGKRTAIDALGIPHRSDEHSLKIQKFRKMMGLTLVDEEVEKILESRIKAHKPLSGGRELERLESLAEYFNKIVVAEHLKTTNKYSSTERSTRVHLKGKDQSKSRLKQSLDGINERLDRIKDRRWKRKKTTKIPLDSSIVQENEDVESNWDISESIKKKIEEGRDRLKDRQKKTTPKIENPLELVQKNDSKKSRIKEGLDRFKDSNEREKPKTEIPLDTSNVQENEDVEADRDISESKKSRIDEGLDRFEDSNEIEKPKTEIPLDTSNVQENENVEADRDISESKKSRIEDSRSRFEDSKEGKFPKIEIPMDSSIGQENEDVEADRDISESKKSRIEESLDRFKDSKEREKPKTEIPLDTSNGQENEDVEADFNNSGYKNSRLKESLDIISEKLDRIKERREDRKGRKKDGKERKKKPKTKIPLDTSIEN